MLKLEFISAGMFSTLQDGGRHGFRFYGIPVSGYMDSISADLANLLVGNTIGSTLIEFSYQGGVITFSEDCQIALTGADLNWKLDGGLVDRNCKLEIRAGQILKGSFTKKGMRAYLAVSGTLMNGKSDMNSESTYTYTNLGGLDGSQLKKGDTLLYETKSSGYSKLEISLNQIKLDSTDINVRPGPEFELLSPSDQKRFLDLEFKISSEANRMGARLEHNVFSPSRAALNHSVPTFPGTIQLLPSGQLIVLLQDGQTTGGYPRIGYIPTDALSEFNQIRIGESAKFRKK